ncbi:MAG: tetratricopeptide repeat protein [Nitrospirae bacterium]|nr:tetratricopeptide repeat protein [Nitrospirota bacterium]
MPEKPTGTLSPEVEKLSSKLEKDPNSKVFLNLAEEYYKAGMLDEALMILEPGLKIHPAFIGAKVLLGRIYSDQKKKKEAREVFEQVIKINGDNIVANKKLSLIYFEEKAFSEAEKCCNQILFFNSKDADAQALLKKIKEAKIAAAQAQVEVFQAPVEAFKEEPVQELNPLTPPAMDEKPVAVVEAVGEQKIEPVQEIVHPRPEAALPVRPVDPLIQRPEPPQISPPPAPANVLDLNQGHLNINQPEGLQPAGDQGAADFGKGIDFSDLIKEEAIISPPAAPLASPNGSVQQQNSLDTVALAQLYIKQGHYDKGIEIYRKMLEQDPANESIKQQLEDAKNIGNLLGLKSQPETIENKIIQTIIPEEERKIAPAVSPAPAPEVNPVSPKQQAKITRLKQWLEALNKSQGVKGNP